MASVAISVPSVSVNVLPVPSKSVTLDTVFPATLQNDAMVDTLDTLSTFSPNVIKIVEIDFVVAVNPGIRSDAIESIVEVESLTVLVIAAIPAMVSEAVVVSSSVLVIWLEPSMVSEAVVVSSSVLP